MTTTRTAQKLPQQVPAHPALNGATFGILTDENPRFPLVFRSRLRTILSVMGLTYEPVRGVYGGTQENSFIVYGADVGLLAYLGRVYGQESVIFSQDGKHQLLFTNGPNAGRFHPGQGHTVFRTAPGDYFSTVETAQGPLHFSLTFDFDTLRDA